MFELKKFTAKKQCIFKGRLIARLITTHTIGTKKENMINMIYVLNRHWSRLLCWSRHNYLKPIYIHEYNVSIIAPTGEGFRACMIYDALHYHQSNRPINAHRELLRTLSFDRGKENKVSRLGTGTVYLRHRTQVRLANAISEPGTAQPVYKEVRELSSF